MQIKFCNPPSKSYWIFSFLHYLEESSFLMCKKQEQVNLTIIGKNNSKPSIKSKIILWASLLMLNCAFLLPGGHLVLTFFGRYSQKDQTLLIWPPHRSRPSWSNCLSVILPTKCLFIPMEQGILLSRCDCQLIGNAEQNAKSSVYVRMLSETRISLSVWVAVSFSFYLQTQHLRCFLIYSGEAPQLWDQVMILSVPTNSKGYQVKLGFLLF